MTKNKIAILTILTKKSASFFALFLLLDLSLVLASGNGEAAAHHASPLDLIPPFINFFILLFLVVGKSRKALRSYFQRHAEHIQIVAEDAEKLYKEAMIKLDMYERKLKTCERECQEIHKSMDVEYVNFTKKFQKEVEDKKQKLKHDGVMMIEQEKTSMMNALNGTFLDSIIEKAEYKVRNDNEIKIRATKNILKAAKL